MTAKLKFKAAKLKFRCALLLSYAGLRRGPFRQVSKEPVTDGARLPRALRLFFWTPWETPGTMVVVHNVLPTLLATVRELGLEWRVESGPKLPTVPCDWLVCFKRVPDFAEVVGQPRRVLLICDQPEVFWHEFRQFDEVVATGSEPFAQLLGTQHPRVTYIGESEPLEYVEFGARNLQQAPLERGKVLFWHGNWHSQDALAHLRPALEKFARCRDAELHLVTNTPNPRVEHWGRLTVRFLRWSKAQLSNTASVARLGLVPARDKLKYNYLKCASRIRCLQALGVPAIGDARVPDVRLFTSAFGGPTAAGDGQWLERLETLWDNGLELARLARQGHATIREQYSTLHTARQWVRFCSERVAGSPSPKP
jgi:hypothetical protein